MPSQKRSTAEQLSDDVEHRHHQRQRPKQSRLQDEHQLLDQEEEEEEEAAVEQEEDDAGYVSSLSLPSHILCSLYGFLHMGPLLVLD
ncbi:hypothetical protein TB1_024760 [Malus domestica]